MKARNLKNALFLTGLFFVLSVLPADAQNPGKKKQKKKNKETADLVIKSANPDAFINANGIRSLERLLGAKGVSKNQKSDLLDVYVDYVLEKFKKIGNNDATILSRVKSLAQENGRDDILTNILRARVDVLINSDDPDGFIKSKGLDYFVETFLNAEGLSQDQQDDLLDIYADYVISRFRSHKGGYFRLELYDLQRRAQENGRVDLLDEIEEALEHMRLKNENRGPGGMH